MKSTKAIEIVLVLVVLTIAYTLFNPFKNTCADGDITQYCVGNTAIHAKCVGFSWMEDSRVDAKSGEECFMGAILNASCTQAPVCVGDYAYASTSCVGGSPTHTYVVCPTKQYCSGGKCVASPGSCGDYECGVGETEVNCYLDCGGLSSWNEYYSSIPDSIGEQYTSCVGEFDCQDPTIAQAVAEMESQYSPKTPKEWIDSATEYVYNHVTYRINGGNAICSEKASDLFDRAYSSPTQKVFGNCIDYSTMFVAMARYKKMPSYQAGVCLTNSLDWQCETYSFIKPKTLPPSPLGYISGNESGGGQVYGHSIVYIYNPLVGKFDIVDPTMRESISKYCYGYSDVLEFGINDQVCYISNYYQNQYCQGF